MWEGRFADNELTAKYFEICSKSYDGKGEKHHVLPRSMWPEYEFCDWNLVNLSVENHYKAHEILPCICLDVCDRKNMLLAWNMMCGKTSGMYADIASVVKLRDMKQKSFSGSGNPMYGMSGELAPAFGRKKTPEEAMMNADASRKYSYECYKPNGEFVKLYPRISDVVTDGFSKNLTIRAANGSTKSHRGFIWKRIPTVVKVERNFISREEAKRRGIEKMRETKSSCSYLQYDEKGNFVMLYPRLKDIVSSGLERSSIDRCCNTHHLRYKGYFWRKTPKVPLPVTEEVLASLPKVIKIPRFSKRGKWLYSRYSLDGEFLGDYISSELRCSGFDVSMVIHCTNGKVSKYADSIWTKEPIPLDTPPQPEV